MFCLTSWPTPCMRLSPSLPHKCRDCFCACPWLEHNLWPPGPKAVALHFKMEYAGIVCNKTTQEYIYTYTASHTIITILITIWISSFIRALIECTHNTNTRGIFYHTIEPRLTPNQISIKFRTFEEHSMLMEHLC